MGIFNLESLKQLSLSHAIKESEEAKAPKVRPRRRKAKKASRRLEGGVEGEGARSGKEQDLPWYDVHAGSPQPSHRHLAPLSSSDARALSASPSTRNLFSPLASPPAPTLAHPSARRPSSASPLAPSHHSRLYPTTSSSHRILSSSRAGTSCSPPLLSPASSHPLLASPHPSSSLYRNGALGSTPSSPHPAHPHFTDHAARPPSPGRWATHRSSSSPAGPPARPASAGPSTVAPHSPLYSATAATTMQRPGALVASVLKASPSCGHSQGDPASDREFTEMLSTAIRRPQSPGPAKTERTAPKYLLSSKKEPELGSQPGKYVDPGGPWRPIVHKETDAIRQELEQPLRGGPYDRVLAVPAHVLAQSLYHPDRPSAQARVKQLQKELKVARADKKLQQDRAYQREVELEKVKTELQAVQHENKIARAHIAALQEQLRLSQGHASRHMSDGSGHVSPSSPKHRIRPQSAALPRRSFSPAP